MTKHKPDCAIYCECNACECTCGADKPYLNPACTNAGCDGTPCGHDGSPDCCGKYKPTAVQCELSEIIRYIREYDSTYPTITHAQCMALVDHITTQATRLAEVEGERDAAECKASRVLRSMLRIGKRLRLARKYARETGQELLCARERLGCPASILSQLCDMRKALGLSVIKTCYTEIVPAISDVVGRAEAAEAKCRELETRLAARDAADAELAGMLARTAEKARNMSAGMSSATPTGATELAETHAGNVPADVQPMTGEKAEEMTTEQAALRG